MNTKILKLPCVLAILTMLMPAMLAETVNVHYPTHRKPLRREKFVPLPLGAVRPTGWLEKQLKIQAAGLTGHLDEFWPSLVTSAWRGGKGEHWERGPYYLDGLVPLAYLLDDERLLAKIKPWIEWILSSQKDNGWFGPEKNKDRWPLAVAMKVLLQYHEATGDERATKVLEKYFIHLSQTPPDWPDKDWRGVRAMENLVSAYWLYNRTGNPRILAAAKSIYENCFDWAAFFIDFPWTTEALEGGKIPRHWKAVGMTAHVVNLGMAVKYAGLRSLQDHDERLVKAVNDSIAKLDLHHGQVGGRFSGDEHLSGRAPTQGTELCGIVEYMFSLENLLSIFGNPAHGDRLEMLAYNAQPATFTPDYWAHQYDQQANQVLCTVAKRRWSTNGNSSNLYGLEPNYGCCTANMHQGWPKFVSHMWMATHDQGLAAIAYGPCVVEARVGDGVTARIQEQTMYPFGGSIRLVVELDRPTTFPLYLRIPGWAEGAQVTVGDLTLMADTGTWLGLRRAWTSGDVVELTLPMALRTETRHRGAVSILRGPLYYSLRIGERFEKLKSHHDTLPSADWAVHPTTPWNYGLLIDRAHPERGIKVTRVGKVGPMPFDGTRAPVILKVRGRRLPGWTLVDHSAGETPKSPARSDAPLEDLELIPYGSTRLRITEFPIWRDEGFN